MFQNEGEGCKESCGHAVCGRRGLESAGIVEEEGGPVRCGLAQGAKALRAACAGRRNARRSNSKPRSPSAI